jgi:hypothetical protein
MATTTAGTYRTRNFVALSFSPPLHDFFLVIQLAVPLCSALSWYYRHADASEPDHPLPRAVEQHARAGRVRNILYGATPLGWAETSPQDSLSLGMCQPLHRAGI